MNDLVLLISLLVVFVATLVLLRHAGHAVICLGLFSMVLVVSWISLELLRESIGFTEQAVPSDHLALIADLGVTLAWCALCFFAGVRVDRIRLREAHLLIAASRSPHPVS
jgi:hypothetical protein